MFQNLDAELERRRITRIMITQDLGLTISTVSSRQSRRSPIPDSFVKGLKSTYEID